MGTHGEDTGMRPPEEWNPVQKISWYVGLGIGVTVALSICAALVIGVVALAQAVFG